MLGPEGGETAGAAVQCPWPITALINAVPLLPAYAFGVYLPVLQGRENRALEGRRGLLGLGTASGGHCVGCDSDGEQSQRCLEQCVHKVTTNSPCAWEDMSSCIDTQRPRAHAPRSVSLPRSPDPCTHQRPRVHAVSSLLLPHADPLPAQHVRHGAQAVREPQQQVHHHEHRPAVQQQRVAHEGASRGRGNGGSRAWRGVRACGRAVRA